MEKYQQVKKSLIENCNILNLDIIEFNIEKRGHTFFIRYRNVLIVIIDEYMSELIDVKIFQALFVIKSLRLWGKLQ